MKKLMFVFVALFVAFALVGCGGGEILENSTKDFYATGNFAGWGDAAGNEEFKLEAIALNDSRVASIKGDLRGAVSLYVLEIVLPATEAGWTQTYTIDGVEVAFDGNLTVKVIRTEKDGDIPEFWAQNPESGKIDNLTPTTMYIPPFVEENVDGAGTWNDNPVALEAGTYYLVFAEFDGSRAMGLIKK
jgi:hypothetical protein